MLDLRLETKEDLYRQDGGMKRVGSAFLLYRNDSIPVPVLVNAPY